MLKRVPFNGPGAHRGQDRDRRGGRAQVAGRQGAGDLGLAADVVRGDPQVRRRDRGSPVDPCGPRADRARVAVREAHRARVLHLGADRRDLLRPGRDQELRHGDQLRAQQGPVPGAPQGGAAVPAQRQARRRGRDPQRGRGAAQGHGRDRGRIQAGLRRRAGVPLLRRGVAALARAAAHPVSCRRRRIPKPRRRQIAVPDPKGQLQPPAAAPVVSRPLRTAASFVLVLPKRRVIYRHWDKEVYLPGEEAELVLEGEGIGDQKYEFVVEKAGSEDGPWEPVASLQAKVEGERASAKYKFPRAEPKGRLVKAEWARARASPGDRLGLHVEAQGYEGGFLSIHVERQQENGSWDVYTRWQGTIEQGKYDGVFPVPPREGASAGQAMTAGRASGALEVDGKIVELSFEQDPVEGGTAWMAARTENLDGSQIRFVLERADEGGTWVEVGSAVSTVTQGRARNSVAMPPGASRSATPESATESRDAVRFAVARLHTHDQVVVSVDPGWLKGESYEVILERRPLDSEGNWESGGAVEQPAASGERVAQPGAREPDAASRQESAGDRPDEHGEVVRAEERHPPAPPEAVQVAPGPRGGESPAPQPGAPRPAAQAQPASAPPATQPERPPAPAASQGQSAPVPRGSPAQPERPPEIAQAKRPVAPPT